MKNIRPKKRYCILLSIMLFACYTGCTMISPYSETAYKQATSSKVEALTLMDKATEPYNTHKVEIEAFQRKIYEAYEYAKGRPKNELSARQWEIMRDPDRYLIGGFISRWEKEDKLGKAFIEEAKQGLITQAFDEIIGLESGKIKKNNAKIVGGE
ncbi:MAG: hypothetical protein NUV86_04165 [Candidatus Scalindua sp.]|nr:hypothetical protein [Candidatus Scalindua sp.]MCR4343670.1 hypothetical protein [Candidatus Scalindua sp.]